MFMGKLKYFQHNVLPCHIPGDYRPAGLLWEDSVNVTFYKSDSGRFLSPSVFSRPVAISGYQYYYRPEDDRKNLGGNHLGNILKILFLTILLNPET